MRNPSTWKKYRWFYVNKSNNPLYFTRIIRSRKIFFERFDLNLPNHRCGWVTIYRAAEFQFTWIAEFQFPELWSFDLPNHPVSIYQNYWVSIYRITVSIQLSARDFQFTAAMIRISIYHESWGISIYHYADLLNFNLPVAISIYHPVCQFNSIFKLNLR